MKKFQRLGLVLLIVSTLGISGVWAQDDTASPTPEAVEEVVVEATQEATVVVEVPPVVVIETPSEDDTSMWFKPEHIIMLILGLGLAFSHPPQTGKIFDNIMKRAQEQALKTPTVLDDAVVEAINKAIKPRLDAFDEAMKKVVNPDGTAVG